MRAKRKAKVDNFRPMPYIGLMDEHVEAELRSIQDRLALQGQRLVRLSENIDMQGRRWLIRARIRTAAGVVNSAIRAVQEALDEKGR